MSSSKTTFIPDVNDGNNEILIMRTAQDAIKAKIATVQAKYYIDPYIVAMNNQQQQSQQSQQHVQVIIKRGTYARVQCIYQTITKFIEHVNNDEMIPQIIVLGSGKDTSFYRIMSSMKQQQQNKTKTRLKWYEVDHIQVLNEKAVQIQQHTSIFHSTIQQQTIQNNYNNNSNPVTVIYKITSSTSTSASKSSSSSSSSPWPEDIENSNNNSNNNDRISCNWIGYDMNDENPKENLLDILIQQCNFNTTQETLIVLECVQMYMSISCITNLLSTFTATLDNNNCHLCMYEPIIGGSSNNNNNIISTFGSMMEMNLTKIGVTTRIDCCLKQLQTINDYINYLLYKCNFYICTGCDMYTAYNTLISTQDRIRINQNEFLDELEEFILIMQHYCFVVASTNNNNNNNIGQKLCAAKTTTNNTTTDNNNINNDNNNSSITTSLLGFVQGKCYQRTKEG